MTQEFNKDTDWALILGGSSGLGLATARKLAENGMNLCVVHRNSRAEMVGINSTFDDIRKHGIKLLSYNIDAAKETEMNSMLNSFKKESEGSYFRCLVHSIARGSLKTMVGDNGSELEGSDFTITFNTMALSLYQWVKAVYIARLFADDSRVLSFTSEGNQKAMKHYAAVSVAKTALEAMTRNIALEFAPYGIKANCIQAGVTHTRSQEMIPGSEEMRKLAAEKNPMNRITKPEDVANVVYLLCKKEAAWINGAIIPVDGGESIC